MGAPDTQAADMEAPGREGIAKTLPHHYGARDDPSHHSYGQRKISGRLKHQQDHGDWSSDNASGNRGHANKSISDRVDGEVRRHNRKARSDSGPKDGTQEQRSAEQSAAHSRSDRQR